MKQEFRQSLEKKRMQRVVEYIVLIAFQGFFVTAFLRVLHPLFAPALAVVACGLAWNLAALREQRRTLGVADSRRLMGDALESMILLLALALLGIGAQFVDIPFVVVMAHLALSLMGFFVGSFLGESVWMKRNVPSLSNEKIENYLGNLNRSLFFPYNLRNIRRVFRRPRRRDDEQD